MIRFRWQPLSPPQSGLSSLGRSPACLSAVSVCSCHEAFADLRPTLLLSCVYLFKFWYLALVLPRLGGVYIVQRFNDDILLERVIETLVVCRALQTNSRPGACSCWKARFSTLNWVST